MSADEKNADAHPLTLDEARQVFREEAKRLLELHQRRRRLKTIHDLAEILSCSKRTAEKIVASGAIKPIWIRGQRRFTAEAVDAYLRRCAEEGRRHG